MQSTQRMATDFTPVGWGVMPPEQPASPCSGAHSEDEEDASIGPSATAVPPEVISAFLQAAHKSSQPDCAASLSTVDEDGAGGPLSSMNSGPLLQPLHNPFAITSSSNSSSSSRQQQQQQPPAAPGLSSQPRQQQGARRRSQVSSQKRPFLRRLVRGLIITTASAGLLAAGAWAGTAAYRHYVAQLDDRDQLARRVAELTKQEQRLLLRCTAIEQERSGLTDRVANLGSAVAESEAARGQLKQRLQQVEADRDEAVRHNLNLQRKLTNLEESHAALTATHKEQQAALDASKVEAARLLREISQLGGVVEKLEAKCAELEASSAQLRSDKAALAAEAQQYKAQAHKLAVLSKS